MTYKHEFPSADGVHYFDSAATGLLPESVIGAVASYHKKSCSNAGRSAYFRSLDVTDMIEESRNEVSAFFGAKPDKLAFTSGATQGINWVANGLKLSPGDHVLITKADHHANILPWLNLQKYGVVIKWTTCDKRGLIDIDDFSSKIEGCKIAAFSGASNVTGAIQPITELTRISKDNGALTLIDVAQLAPHKRLDFENLGCDFMVVSGHKMLSPKGVGVLLCNRVGRKHLNPAVVGGGGILDIDGNNFKMKDFPHGFESGTRPIEGITGMRAALKWYSNHDTQRIFEHEKMIITKIRRHLDERGIKPINPDNSTPLATFWAKNMKPHLLASKLDRAANIMVRTGHMCALPFTREICGRHDGFVRISVGPWNDENDVSRLTSVLDKILDAN